MGIRYLIKFPMRKMIFERTQDLYLTVEREKDKILTGYNGRQPYLVDE